jgi:hypothetical protein
MSAVLRTGGKHHVRVTARRTEELLTLLHLCQCEMMLGGRLLGARGSRDRSRTLGWCRIRPSSATCFESSRSAKCFWMAAIDRPDLREQAALLRGNLQDLGASVLGQGLGQPGSHDQSSKPDSCRSQCHDPSRSSRLRVSKTTSSYGKTNWPAFKSGAERCACLLSLPHTPHIAPNQR